MFIGLLSYISLVYCLHYLYICSDSILTLCVRHSLCVHTIAPLKLQPLCEQVSHEVLHAPFIVLATLKLFAPS